MRYVSYIVNACKKHAQYVHNNLLKEPTDIELSIGNVLLFKLIISPSMAIVLFILAIFLLLF